MCAERVYLTLMRIFAKPIYHFSKILDKLSIPSVPHISVGEMSVTCFKKK